MVDRIKLIMDHYHLSSAQFADRIGFQRSALSHVLSGRNNPSLDFVMKVKAAFPNINLDWLTMGSGNQFMEPGEEPEMLIQEKSEKDSGEIPLTSDTHQNAVGNLEKDPDRDSSWRQADNSNRMAEKPDHQAISKGKKIHKIILLYQDGSFSEHVPEN